MLPLKRIALVYLPDHLPDHQPTTNQECESFQSNGLTFTPSRSKSKPYNPHELRASNQKNSPFTYTREILQPQRNCNNIRSPEKQRRRPARAVDEPFHQKNPAESPSIQTLPTQFYLWVSIAQPARTGPLKTNLIRKINQPSRIQTLVKKTTIPPPSLCFDSTTSNGPLKPFLIREMENNPLHPNVGAIFRHLDQSITTKKNPKKKPGKPRRTLQQYTKPLHPKAWAIYRPLNNINLHKKKTLAPKKNSTSNDKHSSIRRQNQEPTTSPSIQKPAPPVPTCFSEEKSDSKTQRFCDLHQNTTKKKTPRSTTSIPPPAFLFEATRLSLQNSKRPIA